MTRLVCTFEWIGLLKDTERIHALRECHFDGHSWR